MAYSAAFRLPAPDRAPSRPRPRDSESSHGIPGHPGLAWRPAVRRRGSTPLLQRSCECGGTGGKCSCPARGSSGDDTSPRLMMQRLFDLAPGSGGRGFAPSAVHDVIDSPGAPLDGAVRAFFEPRLGHDLSSVRVHSDDRAMQSTRAVGAAAYAVGEHIVLGRPGVDLSTRAGRRLLAHELGHVVQHPGRTLLPPRGSLRIGESGSELERDAERTADGLLAGRVSSDARASTTPDGSAVVRRQVATDETATLTSGQPVTGRSQSGPGRSQSGPGTADGRPGCAIAPGVDNSVCSAYSANSSWLPDSYVVNATCACSATPNVPTAMCVRKTLQDRLTATPAAVKKSAAAAKMASLLPGGTAAYEGFVQTVLTPRIYEDHVIAYRDCCCTSGPAPYADWMAVTSIPVPSCSLTGWFIRRFGSCHGTPGTW